MTAEQVTLVAALIAALTSVVTLGLNARLALLRERRMLLWQKELERLTEVEEWAGIAQEVSLSYASPQVLEAEFKPIHDKLRLAAGRFGRYPKLAAAPVQLCLRRGQNTMIRSTRPRERCSELPMMRCGRRGRCSRCGRRAAAYLPLNSS